MIRKIFNFFLCFFIFTPLAQAQDIFPFVGRINTNKVNVRAGQSNNFEKLIRLSENSEVVVVGKKYSWYKIRLPRQSKAYIFAKFVKIIDEDQNKGIVIGSRINVRAGRGTNFSILGQVNAGDEVLVLSHEKDWMQIEPLDSMFGWVADKFLEYKDADVDTFLAKVEEPEPRVEEPETPAEPMVIKGELRTASATTGYENVAYLLYVDDQPRYYIEGMNDLLDDFVNHKVEIEGMEDKSFVHTLSHPVLSVSRVEYVL
ncbi:MAG: SH3 domain-containing protein [Candidatus Omnitrophica bacterium]|nr:SH3 domain-containing protein [Candidatus Omnitrophota bacterium]